jgi:hypothetical protein
MPDVQNNSPVPIQRPFPPWRPGVRKTRNYPSPIPRKKAPIRMKKTDPMSPRMIKAGMEAIAHFTIKKTMDQKGILMSVTTMRFFSSNAYLLIIRLLLQHRWALGCRTLHPSRTRSSRVLPLTLRVRATRSGETLLSGVSDSSKLVKPASSINGI